jgi:hypothetical protein
MAELLLGVRGAHHIERADGAGSDGTVHYADELLTKPLEQLIVDAAGELRECLVQLWTHVGVE